MQIREFASLELNMDVPERRFSLGQFHQASAKEPREADREFRMFPGQFPSVRRQFWFGEYLATGGVFQGGAHVQKFPRGLEFPNALACWPLKRGRQLAFAELKRGRNCLEDY